MTKHKTIEDDEFYAQKILEMLMNQSKILKQLTNDCSGMTKRIITLENNKNKK